MAPRRRVLIVDDHPLFRDALDVALERAMPGMIETVHAGTLADALEQLGKDQFTLVLLDLNMSDTEGFDGLTRLLAASGDAKVAIVSATESTQAFATAKTLGASAYLPKSLPPKELTYAIWAIFDEGGWYPDFKEEDEAVSDAARNVAQLTPAQRRVLNGLAAGLLNKQIAYEMGISDATVKAHMTAIMRKLGATNRTQALLIYRDAVS